ncbi:SUN domain-containing protein 2-like [Iris pallida]|uniref:SUN domain-containing protein 2-like n=1 Tax=Iris pallida TaxID=29817 RepID=A0AAX6H4U4_IRIPA|nr:SUN domain-containing protein 2-like [Iris pallida]
MTNNGRNCSTLFVLICFLLLSSHAASDSCIGGSNGVNSIWKEVLFESFLSSATDNNFAICKPRGCQDPSTKEDPIVLDNRENHRSRTSSHPTYIGLDEFRSKTLSRKKSNAHDLLDKITHRLEPGGKEYNYASSSKGAKVLAHNKEAKGAGNILERDIDKYLRNPCSVNEKFVIIELSEETLVDSIQIANLEHYSSNFKDFELSGSLIYPTETWIPLGNFTAENVKHAQRFTLLEPKWVRYMRLSLLSHYGSEFYCTLSSIEVYGVDAIEKLLEDFMTVTDENVDDEIVSLETGANSSKNDDTVQTDGLDFPDKGADFDELKKNVSKNSVPPQVKDVRQQSASRMPSDAVLKILMEKVRSLELSLSVLEEYIKDLERRYGGALPDFQKEVSQNLLLLEKIRSDVKELIGSKEVMEREYNEIESWKLNVSAQIDSLLGDGAFLRENVEKILSNQEIMEKKELRVLIVSFFSACFALFKIICDWIVNLFGTCEPEKMHQTSRGWLFLFVSSSMATLIALVYR